MTIGEFQYNASSHTFITPPLLQKNWSVLSNDAGGSGTGVTLGTDDWYPQQGDFFPLDTSSAPFQGAVPFYNRLGTDDLSTFFNKNDNPFWGRFTVWCSFADGLVDTSARAFTGGTFNGGDLAATAEIENSFSFRLNAGYVDENGLIVNNGSFDIPFHQFNTPMDLGLISPQNLGVLRGLGQSGVQSVFFKMGVLVLDNPKFSTVTIATGFQTKSLMIWASLDMLHTFPTSSSPS